MSTRRAGEGPASTLARAGLVDTERALGLLDELQVGGVADGSQDGLVEALGRVADPDEALLGLVRLREVMSTSEQAALADVLEHSGLERDRLLQVLGASSALTDHLVRHPEHWHDACHAELADAPALTRMVQDDIDARPPDMTRYDALRVAYRRQIVRIAAVDLTSDAREVLPEIAAALADLAAAALEAALHVARDEVQNADSCRLSVIGMGKCGGRELNYVSDVDVIFVAEPAEGVEEDDALTVATALATSMMRACSASTGEGTLWPVDAALRPEGKQGPLVRTIASHRAYYERWAKTWEFQALLKARHVAGDSGVGEAYLEAVLPFVWQASKRDNFVGDVQSMRRRVEQHVPAAEAPRQLKLGPGGLRDIEFSVQLLQLVHGRTDDLIRFRGTLTGLEALSTRGYVGRTDAHHLDDAYRLLRVLEHRIQLHRMRRTHLVPTAEADLRRLGRSVGLRSESAKAVTKLWRDQAREVRRMHERLFYRPLLSAVARLDDDAARLSMADARERLAALGFQDPAGALRHVQALTTGVSRRAVMQRTLLPVMLQWFAEEADPDAGLLSFRKISEDLGSSPWFLMHLREGSAAEQLARVLARSRYAGAMLERSPSSVGLLGSGEPLEPRARDVITEQMRRAAARHDDAEASAHAVRSVRRTELVRVSVADLLGAVDLERVEDALTDIARATLQSLFDIAIAGVTGGNEPLCRLAVIGMGRFGGREMGYSSDADVMFVYEPLPSTDETAAGKQALAVVTELTRLATLGGPDPAFEMDADLRPEGRSGPLIRSLDSYAAYYERWSEGWEAQALLRAKPVAGDAELGEKFSALIDPLRWPADGISSSAVRQIRTLKARMEAERIPRGGDRKTHFKLGHGGLSDVEWTVQLLQLQHACAVPALRHTGTLTPLRAAAAAGLLDPEEADALLDAWTFATRVRNAAVLWRGRAVDALPSDVRDGDGIGRILGYPPASGPQVHDDYRRSARHARAVVDRVFYGM
ncbi:bifunctional [glutamine synthetase] adenylyltransferase/[glutamine synthetase]-adenylyl-L-tyrosine phosphorylase [Demetria terragena]|uniref:bifunctional [glutamine synthetase] adenylyltransferase/[glutamine synthetase]-adenylyl-L-tyrosine phosphorylase n=1 Tax=Demetria terragena TaxID=63959 RepID=UPI0003766DAA|nr:bifunctional [glutamine synthetase] adenylyltransferase/[glutamine synthetase]-adenylyl-L-tyrosine phosphorylase [Demetria terragena]